MDLEYSEVEYVFIQCHSKLERFYIIHSFLNVIVLYKCITINHRISHEKDSDTSVKHFSKQVKKNFACREQVFVPNSLTSRQCFLPLYIEEKNVRTNR